MRPVYRLAVFAFLIAGLESPILAAVWEFVPFVNAGLVYDENVNVTRGVQTEGEDPADFVFRLAVTLSVTRRERRGHLTLSYAPAYEAYRQFQDLDYLGHAASLNLHQEWGRENSVDLRYSLSRSDRQGRLTVDEAGDPADVLVPRESITRNSLNGLMDLRTGRRSSILLGLRWTGNDYGGDAADLRPANANSYFGRVGMRWRHSGRFSTSYSYEIGLIEERVETRATHSLQADLNYETDPRSRLTVSIGATRADPATDEAGGEPIDPDAQADIVPAGGIRWTRELKSRSTVGLGVRQGIGSSSGVGRVVVTRVYYATFQRPLGPRWSGSVAFNLTDRSGFEDDPATADRSTMLLELSVDRRLGQTLGLRGSAARVRQQDFLDESPLTTSYGVYYLGLQWRPRGWQ